MTKLILILISVIAGVLNSRGQNNLVPNGDFETLHNPVLCNVGTIKEAPPWQNPSGGSPNYFNACTTLQPDYDVPQNIFGYQFAHSGTGYADIGPYNDKPLNFREYIQVGLIDPLREGKKYEVKFYVSLSDSSTYATDQIGMYFSDTAINKSIYDSSPFNVIPQIETPKGSFFVDKINWTLISGIFSAKGGEKYITIGNFHDDANTDTLNVGGAKKQGKYSCYYIDDVSVVDSDNLGIEGGNNTKELEISVYPNPANEEITISNTTGSSAIIKLYDYVGKEITSLKLDMKVNILSLKDVPSGIYLFRTTDCDGWIIKTGKLIIIK